MVAIILEVSINKQRNYPETMKKVQEQCPLADITKNVETKIRKLASGTSFFNDTVALNSDNIWAYQQNKFVEKQVKKQIKQSTTKQAFLFKKRAPEKIRK
jgi:hypothetical protein